MDLQRIGLDTFKAVFTLHGVGHDEKAVLDLSKDSCAILTHPAPMAHNRQFTASTVPRMPGVQ